MPAAAAIPSPELAHELHELRKLVHEQQQAATRQALLIQKLVDEQAGQPIPTSAAGVVPGGASSGLSESGAVGKAVVPPVKASAAANKADLASVALLERRALDQCTEADVPILALLRKPCPPNRHGYGCHEHWGLRCALAIHHSVLLIGSAAVDPSCAARISATRRIVAHPHIVHSSPPPRTRRSRPAARMRASRHAAHCTVLSSIFVTRRPRAQ